MPEHLIGLDLVYYLRDHLAVQCKTPSAVTPEATAEHIRYYCCKGTIYALCEDIVPPAGSTLDADRLSEDKDQKITVPVLALWDRRALLTCSGRWHFKCVDALPKVSLMRAFCKKNDDAVVSEFRAFFRAKNLFV